MPWLKRRGESVLAGLSYANADVKTVPLAFAEGQDFVAIDSPEADMGL